VLRIVVVAFEEEIEQAFKVALGKLVKRPNEDVLEVLPLMILDSMLPRQRLTFSVDRLMNRVDLEQDRFAMVGVHGGSIISAGVEVRVVSRRTVGDSVELEVVGGRRFTFPGHPSVEEEPERTSSKPLLRVSLEWVRDEDERPIQGELALSETLEPLVERWLRLVRAGRERQPGQMDMILEHLGPMPPASEVTDRALWVAALINPLPGLGVAWEIRPAILNADSSAQRLDIARKGLQASLENLANSA